MATTTPRRSAAVQLTLISKNEVSPQDAEHVLTAAFTAEDYRDCIKGLTGYEIDPQAYIDGLDRIIDFLKPRSENYRSGLLALRKACGIYGLLPSSYIKVEPLTLIIAGSANRPIASGACTDTWKAMDSGGCTFVVRQLRVYETDDLERVKRNFYKAVIACGRVKHKNVLSNEGFAPALFELCMVSKWMDNGNMQQYVRSHQEVNRMRLLIGITRGLHHLHSNGIIHRKLRSSNILIDRQGNPRIADFGFPLPEDYLSPNAHEPNGRKPIRWSAPELFDTMRPTYTTESDIYALSMVIVELYSGNIPFPNNTDIIVMLLVIRGDRPPKPASPKAVGLTSTVWALTKRCWDKNPAKRPNTSEILAHLEGRIVSPSLLQRAKSLFKSGSTVLNPAAEWHFDYHSKTHGMQPRNPGPNQKGRQVSTQCEQCKQRPKFQKGSKVYPYCGRTCAKLAANNSLAPANPPANPPIYRKAHSAPLQPTSSGQACQSPGCGLPPFVRQDGTPSKHCVTHVDWGEHGCISCRTAPMIDASVLCQPCHDTALSTAPVIIEVPEGQNTYKSVKKQFRRSWKHNTTCPEVKAVYKIIVTEASLNQYQEYLDSVEARGNFVASGKSRGNEHRRWHGTKRKCNLGDPGNKTFCTNSDCSLCRIIQTSFDLKFFKAATGWGRFGRGIYTSSTSSKSNDYSKNIGINSEWKALLLNKVVVGNGKKLTQGDKSLTGPPMGYDSVVAEVVPGEALNYDELVVYRNEAVRPSYLVMYESP